MPNTSNKNRRLACCTGTVLLTFVVVWYSFSIVFTVSSSDAHTSWKPHSLADRTSQLRTAARVVQSQDTINQATGARSDDMTEAITSACSVLPLHDNVTGVFDDQLQLCFSEEQCSGQLRISFKSSSSCYASKRVLSRNGTLNDALLALGPDVFRYRLEGPETIAGISTHQGGRCQYFVQIPQLRRSGTYRLGLEWLYKDYHAQDEITNQWPHLLKQSLLPVLPGFETNYHRQQCTLPSTVALQCNQDRPAVPAAVCTGLERDTTGRWVIDEANSGKYVYTRVRVKKIQRNPIVFQWALQRDEARHWEPNACRMVQQSHISVTRAISVAAQRLVIGGDSQLRALYFGVANFLSGQGSDCLRNISTEAAEPRRCIENVKGSQRKLIGGMQVDFVDDLFLDRFANSERYAGYHTVVVGFAQHPASKEHWSFDRYRQSFQSKLQRAVQLKQAGKLVIWYLAPQYPHTTLGFPVYVRDWRTDVRLQMFNAYAKEQCLTHGIPVVDAFAITTPFSHTSPDQAHFSNFVSYELVQMMVNVMCSHYGGCGGA